MEFGSVLGPFGPSASHLVFLVKFNEDFLAQQYDVPLHHNGTCHQAREEDDSSQELP
jgi:hypothetical protein